MPSATSSISNPSVDSKYKASSVFSASSSGIDSCDFTPEDEVPFELLEDIDKRFGPDIADGVEYQWRRMRGGSKEAADHNLPGIGRDLEAMAKYFTQWRGKATHIDSITGNPVAYDEAKGVIMIIQTRFIHGYCMPKADFVREGSKYVPKPS